VRISYGSIPILLLLFCPTAAWAIAGCQAYGGYIYGGNPALQESDLFEANMDVLNFNDFASAMMIFLTNLVSGGVFTEIIDALGTPHADTEMATRVLAHAHALTGTQRSEAFSGPVY